MPDQSGKVAIVTGSNSGIGFQMALALAGKGARVTLACRSAQRAEDAKALIHETHQDAEIEIGILDLADLSSVSAFAGTFKDNHDRLDLLINNAGVMVPPKSKTRDGFELQFGTNHLGHFALTGHLLPMLENMVGSRVVSVSSMAHNMGTIDFDDLQWETRRYSKWRSYSQSKLACLMFAIELDRRLKASGSNVISLASHPGWSATNLQRHSLVLRVGNLLFAMHPRKGAAPTLYASSMPDATGHLYWGPGGIGEVWGSTEKSKIKHTAMDEDVAERLWRVSEDLTGVSYLS